MNDRIMNGIDSIDDSLIEEAMNYRRTRKPIYIAAGAAAAVAVISAVALSSITMHEELTGAVPDGDPAVTVAGGGKDTTVLSDNEISFTGEAPTDDELREYIEKNKNIFALLVMSETKDITGDINISLAGHSYLKTSDNTVALDNITYPIFADDSVIAEVTLFKVNGELLYTLSAGGGMRLDRINKALSEHPGEEFVFLYTGVNSEYMISPDNTIYDIRSISEVPLHSHDDWYNKYYTEHNTFNFSEVLENKQYITVRKEDVYEETN